MLTFYFIVDEPSIKDSFIQGLKVIKKYAWVGALGFCMFVIPLAYASEKELVQLIFLLIFKNLAQQQEIIKELSKKK